MKHLILVGACYLDTILTNVSRPMTQILNLHLAVSHGFHPKTRNFGLRALTSDVEDDIKLHLVSCLPNASSEATRRIISSFGQESEVDFSHCIYRPGNDEAASSYIIRSEESGSRTLVNYNDLPEMTAGEFESVVKSFSAEQDTLWHFEGRIPDTTLECFHLLRELLPKARISVEVEKPGREGLPELASEADFVFYSKTWAENRGHSSAEACLKNENFQKASLALCTWGADGAAALSRPAGECVHCPVDNKTGNAISVVDAVGAGDTFIAGILYCLLCHPKDWNVRQQTSFAVELATLKVQREGFGGLGDDSLCCRKRTARTE